MNRPLDNKNRRPWRPHCETWAAACVLLAASVYLNLNVVDLLYRVKYGPVRPALVVDGWPFRAIDVDPISSAISINRDRLLANACVTLIILLGTAAGVERWRRQRRTGMQVRSEHLIGLGLLAAVVLALEFVNESGVAIDTVDYAAAFRQPARAVLFIGLAVTCLSFVEWIGLLANRLTGGHGEKLQQ